MFLSGVASHTAFGTPSTASRQHLQKRDINNFRTPSQILLKCCSKLLTLCLTFAVISPAFSQISQSGQPQPTTERLPDILVTASALISPQNHPSQPSTILTRADIVQLNPSSLNALLSLQVGIAIDSSPRTGNYASLYLRGADPSHVVILIDGIRQNDPLSSRGSAVDLNTMALADIERIEIVRGSASVVHREALAGIVQIFTKRQNAKPSVNLQIGVGGDGYETAAALWRGDNISLSATTQRDGIAANDGRSKSNSFNAAFHSQIGDSTTLKATLRATDADNLSFPDDSGGRRFAVGRTKEHRQAETQQGTIQATSRFDGFGILESSISMLSRQSEESSPGVARGLRDPAGLPPIDSLGDYRRNEMYLWWRPALRQNAWQAMVGIDGQTESVTYDSRIRFGPAVIPAVFKQKRETLGLIIEARYENDGWGLQSGLRMDHAKGRDDIHPVVSTFVSCGVNCGTFGASWSSAVKLPSFYALAHPLVGNPLLKPESTRQFEMYYATSPGAAWRGRIALFSARYQDLIDFDAGPPPRLLNRARINSSGIEVTSQHELNERMSLHLNATAIDIRDPLGGPPLRQRAKQQASARLSRHFTKGWDGQLQLKYVGSRYDSSIPTGNIWLPAYTTLDATLNINVEKFRIVFALDNLLNKRFDETIGTAATSRRVRLGIQWQM